MSLTGHIPNILTASRLLLCPLIVILFLGNHPIAGLILFLVASATDFLDGFLARRWKVESQLGSVLDPVCDKLFTVCFFTVLMSLGSCPPWFLAFIISIMLLQFLGYLLLKLPRAKMNYGISPPRIAKWNMALQLTWIGTLFAETLLRQKFPVAFQYSFTFQLAGYSALTMLQVIVFFRYVYRYRFQLLPNPRLLFPNNAKHR